MRDNFDWIIACKHGYKDFNEYGENCWHCNLGKYYDSIPCCTCKEYNPIHAFKTPLEKLAKRINKGKN